MASTVPTPLGYSPFLRHRPSASTCAQCTQSPPRAAPHHSAARPGRAAARRGAGAGRPGTCTCSMSVATAASRHCTQLPCRNSASRVLGSVSGRRTTSGPPSIVTTPRLAPLPWRGRGRTAGRARARGRAIPLGGAVQRRRAHSQPRAPTPPPGRGRRRGCGAGRVSRAGTAHRHRRAHPGRFRHSKRRHSPSPPEGWVSGRAPRAGRPRTAA